MDRRKFIASNLVAIPTLKGLMKTEENISAQAVRVKFYCPRWGADDSWDSFCRRVKEAGFDGIEAALSSPEAPEKNELLESLNKNGLELIGQYYQSHENDFDAHAANYERHLRSLASLKPIFINAQTGKDYFTLDQNLRLINIATKVAKETGINIVHETHRGKALFAVHIANQFFQRLPNLRVTLDISHWCNVHESLLHDQKEMVDVALSRTSHIHSRIGHPEGPQVNDPRAGEWKDVVDAHLKWWDAVVEHHRKAGRDLTITTEFGPPTYMPVLPYTQQPIASQWDINVHMMNILKKRYS
jgi:sugar phosphate isomerase/epimerase